MSGGPRTHEVVRRAGRSEALIAWRARFFERNEGVKGGSSPPLSGLPLTPSLRSNRTIQAVKAGAGTVSAMCPNTFSGLWLGSAAEQPGLASFREMQIAITASPHIRSRLLIPYPHSACMR
jgi:hypothetical protein